MFLEQTSIIREISKLPKDLNSFEKKNSSQIKARPYPGRVKGFEPYPRNVCPTCENVTNMHINIFLLCFLKFLFLKEAERNFIL